MKIYSLLPGLTMFVAGVFAGFGHAQVQSLPAPIPARLPKAPPPKWPLGTINIPPSSASLQKNIDLSAESINFSMVTVMDRLNAVVKIEGVVRNVGRLNYASGTNQQSAFLYEDNGGVLKLVASQPFQNLDVNATAKVSFIRNWYQASPAEGEFPPNYILVISFDPDIYIDGNDNNDDANNANNKISRSARELNLLSFKK